MVTSIRARLARFRQVHPRRFIFLLASLVIFLIAFIVGCIYLLIENNKQTPLIPEPDIWQQSYVNSKLVFSQYDSGSSFSSAGELILFDGASGTKRTLWSKGAYQVIGWSPDNKTILFRQVKKTINESGLQISTVPLTGIDVSTAETHESTTYINGEMLTKWISNSQVLTSVQNDVEYGKWTIDSLSYPDLEVITHKPLSVSIIGEINPSNTFILTSTPPEDSKPIIYNVETASSTYLSDLLPKCEVASNTYIQAGLLWVSDTSFLYACGNSYFTYDIASKQVEALFDLPDTDKYQFISVSHLKLTSNHIYGLVSQFNDVANQEHYIADYDINSKTFTKLYTPKSGLGLEIKDFAVDKTRNLLAVIARSTDGEHDLSYITNIKTGIVWDLCETDSCLNIVWSN